METERSSDSDGSATSRRGFLRTAAVGATATSVAAGATGTATAQEGTATESSGPTFDGWLEPTTNYDGEVVDATGEDSITIAVGGSSLVFDPPAVRVDPGTTITWEWEGGRHNVVGENRDFSSGDPTSDTSTTYEQSFEETGVVKYVCEPHSGNMRGVVVVGDAEIGAGEGGEGGDHGGGELVLTDSLLAMGVALVLGVLSPILFAVHLAMNRDKVGGRGNSGDGELKRIDSQD